MDTLQHMNSLLREMEQRSDQRSAFLRCYSLISGNMVLASREGGFHDCEWMQHFVGHFASYYFHALDQYDGTRESAPNVWVLAHDTALHASCPTIQKLLLGINAHINYDLVLTLVDLLEKEWPGLDEAGRTRRDEVWEKAVELLEVPDISLREKIRQELEARTLTYGEAILFRKGLWPLKDLW